MKIAVNGAPEGRAAAVGDVISVPEACELLSVHRNTLYRLIHEGELPAFKLTPGGRWRFRRGELEQWLEDKQGRGAR